MNVSRFPCRRCDTPTDGIDTYVICADCLDALEEEANDEIRTAPIDGNAADSLRRLLDSW